MKIKVLIPIILSLLTINCNKIYLPNNPTPVDNTPKVIHDSILFHVIGNPLGAKVRYSNSVDGLNQTTTTLPFQVSLDSTKNSVFLYLEATATGFSGVITNPFLEVQITVNGNLFREASTSSSFFDTISVSGTYSR